MSRKLLLEITWITVVILQCSTFQQVVILQCSTFQQVNGVCAPPATVTNGSYLPDQTNYAETENVTYSCATGYNQTAGDATLTCVNTDNWVGTAPTCTIVTCAEVIVGNASKTPDTAQYNYNEDVTYACDTGYTHTSGDLVRTCTASGSWNGTSPICTVVTCSPDAVPNSSKSPDQTSYDYNTIVTYSCDTGYELASGNLARTCQADTTWSGATPVCSIVTCLPDAVPNSSYSPLQASFIYNTIVTYSCDTGYELASGNLARTCQADTTWSGATPVCSIVACLPDAVPNSSKSPDQTSYDYNTIVTYSCDTGYELASGNLARTCQADTTWSGATPVCSIVTCLTDAVPNSSYSPLQASFIYNTIVTYSCDTGYELASGNLARTCQADTTWSGATPVCSIVTCLTDAVPNSSYSPLQASFIYNTIVTYSCDTGYELASGNLARTCQADTTWSGATPVCFIVTCLPDAVPNSSKSPSQATYDYNTNVTYSCDTGYEHASGNLTRTCQVDATWSAVVPVCSIVTCLPDAVPYSSKSPDQTSYDYNTIVAYSCDTGYELASGNLTRTCQADTTWSGAIPVCSIVTCLPHAVPYSSKSPDQVSYDYNTIVTYSCETGYELASGNLARTCQADATWSGATPVCSIVTCLPDAVPNSSKSPDQTSHDYNTIVTYSCDIGYELASGNLARTCQADTTWSGATPVCSIVTCVPDTVANSSMSPLQASFIYNTIVTYSCDTGYELASGNLARTCQADTTWSGAIPVCSIKQCPAEAVPNSLRTPDLPSYDYNTNVTYACDVGYNLTSGDSERTCQADKTWTGVTPVCTILTCDPPEDVTNATKSPNQTSYDYNIHVNYICQTGYELDSGDGDRVCQANQTWSGTAPTACIIKNCSAPAAVAQATVTPVATEYDYNTTITYACDVGYKNLSGDFVRTCQDSKTFSGTAPSCTIKQCASETVGNGTASPDIAMHNFSTSVTYTCDLSYAHTAGDLVRTCNDSEMWTGTLPTCTVASCLPVNTLNGTIAPVNATYSFGETVTYSCDAGYYHSAGDVNRTCETSGLFDGTLPTCSRVECDPPVNVTNADYTPYIGSVHDYGTTVTFTCNLAFNNTAGDLVRTCQQNFNWNGSEPVCSPYACIQENSTFMTTVPDQQLHDFYTDIVYTCIIGYNYSSGDVVRTCHDDGQWNGTLPECVIVTCPIPLPPANASISPEATEINYNTNMTYTCDLGYNRTAGDATRRCTETSLFEGTEALCTIVECDPPVANNYSSFTPVQPRYNYSDTATYSCDYGYYYISGDNTSMCNEFGIWTGTPITCSIVQCANPGDAHADNTPDQPFHDFNTSVASACVIGYNLTGGDDVRICQANATWDGTPPNCTIVECDLPAPVAISSFSPLQSVYVYLDVITWTCVIGYEVTIGNSSRQCRETGLWSGSAPICTIKHCPPPTSVQATHLPSLVEHEWNSSVTYTCNFGYNHSTGDLQRTCLDNKTWSGASPVCLIVTCDKVDIPFMTFTPPTGDTHDFNTTIEYACDIGYNYSYGDVFRTCDHTGKWTGQAPNCTIVECDTPAPVDMSTHSPQPSVYVYLDVITWICDVGYEITSGDASRKCNETGLWMGTAPNCTIKHCVPPDAGVQTTYVPVLTEHDWNTTVIYTCTLIGYNHSTGDLERTCQDNKTWSGSSPVCLIVTCDKIDVPFMTFTPPTSDTHDFNTTIEYSCDIGYNHSYGDLSRTCDETGQWTGQLPNCTIVECDTPAPVAMSTHSPQPSVYVYLDVITWICDVGYEITSGDASRQCNETGIWMGTAPNCTIKHCVPPDAGVQTTYVPVLAEHDWNTTVIYNCTFGYNHSTGDLERTCQDNKSWSGSSPVCLIVTCDKIDVPFMAFTPPTSDTHDFNTTIEYSCVIGYNHSHGDLSRTCDETGQWTGLLPNCTIVECDPPAPVAMSTHIPQPSVYVYLDIITWTCDVGYEITSGDASRQCNETGIWMGTAPNCTIKHCVPPDAGVQTTYVPVLAEHDWNTTVIYNCTFGFNHSTGDLERICQDNKMWSGSSPVCLIVTCDKIDVPFMTFTPPTPDTHDFNTTIDYSCVIGYNHSYGDLSRTCDEKGQWTGLLPNCTIVECDFPPVVTMSTHSPPQSVYVYLDVITWTCDVGYEMLSGDASRQCKETSLWTGTAPNCTIKHCVPPDAGVQTTYVPVLIEHDWNTTVIYTCTFGYNHSTGDLERTCQDDKTWSGSSPVCLIVTCDKIDVQYMTFTPPTTDTHDFNTTIEYACVIGYNHSYGDLFRTCDHLGQWTGVLPNCTIITCDPPVTISHTSYTPYLLEHDWNTSIDYSCDADWHYVSGINVTTCNESGSFPPVDFNCSVQHTLAADPSEPTVKWMNSTVNETIITYVFDGLCDVTWTITPALLDVSYAIVGNEIQVTLTELPSTAFDVYSLVLSPFRLGRNWADYERTVFYGEEIQGFTALVDNPIKYLAVGTSYNFETNATQGTTVTLDSVMGDGNVYSTNTSGVFSAETVTHTYNTPGEYDVTFTLTNLVSSQIAVVPVVVIYRINNFTFQVVDNLTNVTTAADCYFNVKASAGMPMDFVNITIDYKHGSGDTGSLDLGNTASVPIIFTYSHLFDVQGQYIVDATAINHVSSELYSLTVDVWDSLLPLDFVFFNGTGKYITNTTAQFEFVNTPDAGFEYIIDYGDGESNQSAGDNAIWYQPYGLSVFNHVYTMAGLYTVQWTAWNGWGPYNRSQTFQVLVQNRVPIYGFTLQPMCKKYPWINLQSMQIPVNITLNDTVPLPTNATCTFDPKDGKSLVPGLSYNMPLVNYDHSFTDEGIFNATYDCSNEVSQYTYEVCVIVEKYQASSLSVNFQELVPMNISGSVIVDFFVESGGYALIPEQVFLGWDFGNGGGGARRRRAVGPYVLYNESMYSNLYTLRGNYTVQVDVKADVTGTLNSLYYSLRVGIMYFEYDNTVAFINTTTVRYSMHGVLGNATYTLDYDGKSVDGSCDAYDYNGCYIDHQCPSYGYMLVTAIATNGSFVEIDTVNITCDNPIPTDMEFSIPNAVAIPDGWVEYKFKIKTTDLYLPQLTCRMNFGDPVYRKDITETQKVTVGSPFNGSFQYLALGVHPVTVECWNLINVTYHKQSVIVTNKDFLFSGVFDRQYSQSEGPLLISAMRDTEIFGRLIILADETIKTHFNNWTINGTMTPPVYDRQSLLFTRGELIEALYNVKLKISFVQETNNSIFEPTYVMIVMVPPHAEILGGRRRLVSRGPVTVDAAKYSYDPARPDSPTTGLSFSWVCKCYDATSFENAASKHAGGDNPNACSTTNGIGSIIVDTNDLPHKEYYVVEVTVSNGRGMSATFQQILKYDPNKELSILCNINCLAKVAVTSDLQLVPNQDHNCPGSFTWELQNKTNLGDSYGSQIDLDDITKTGDNNRSLTITAGSLLPGMWYLVTLTTLDGGVQKTAYHEFVTNRPPQGGACRIIVYDDGPLALNVTLPEEPTDYANLDHYLAAERQYNMTCTGWQDEGFSDNTYTTNEPLFYFFFLSFNNSDDSQRQILYFDPGSTANLVTFQLGDPDIAEKYRATVVLRITDVFGDYAELRYNVISETNLTTDVLAPLSNADRVAKLREFINKFASNMTKDNTTFDYRSLSRKIMDITSIYNNLELNTSSSVTLTPEDLLSLGYKEDDAGNRISWSDYWRLIVEVVDTSTADYLMQTGERYTQMIHDTITTWPTGKKITIIAIETMSRALGGLTSRTENTNVTAAKLAAHCVNIMTRNLAAHSDDRPFPNTEMLWSAAIAIRSLISNLVLALQTVLTPNLPEDPTVDEMRNYLEYMQIFKTTEEVASEPLSLQEQTFLAQKQLQKYFLAKYIKSEASKLALPNITEALRNLTYVLQRMSVIGQQELALEDDIIYVSTEIVPAYVLRNFTIIRPRVAMDVGYLNETSPKQCSSSLMYIRSIIFKTNPYFWGTFADRISSYVPVFEIDGGRLIGDTVTFRLGNKVVPECRDATPTYDENDPNKMIYILFDRQFGDDDLMIFVRPNGSLTYQVYFNKDEKPSIEDNKYLYSTEIKTDKWTQQDGYKLMVKSTEFPTTGKIWIALRPLLENTADLSQLTLPFCANVTSVNCLAWVQDADGEFFWDKTRCEVSRSSSLAETECICKNPGDGSPMTVGTTFYVPPSKVDFNTLEDSVTVYGRAPVLGMIIATMIAYVLLVFWAWREDVKDQYKWSYSLLIDNDIADSYFYIMKVYTGLRAASGTRSNIGFILGGNMGNTGERILDDESHVGFERGSVRTFVMSTRRKLGELLCLRVWHDDSGGPAASWYLNKVVVTDLQHKTRYVFPCDQWFTFDTGDQQVDRTLVARPFVESNSVKDMISYTVAENHIWISLFLRPLRSNFTRIQRLACLMGLIYVTMIVSVMILKTPDENTMTEVVIGPFRFSMENFETSIIAITVGTFVIMVVMFFFRNSEAPDKPNDVYSWTRRAYRKVNDKIQLDKSVLSTTYEPPAQTAISYDYHFLPHFCKYIGWTILLVVGGIATYLLYEFSDEWKLVKSEEWMTSIFVAFISSILFLEPCKILIMVLLYGVFCPRAYEPPDPYIDIEDLLEITKHNSATLMHGPQFDDVLKTPISPDEETLIQNKIDRIRDHQLLKIFSQLFFFSAVLYLVYTISYQSRDPMSFYLKDHVVKMYNFSKEVNDKTTYLAWLNGTFIHTYFSKTYFGAPNTDTTLKSFCEDLTNVRVGPARLRQLRVMPEACKGPLGVNMTCRNKYEEKKSDQGNYCVTWNLQPCDVSQKSKYFTSAAWLYTSAEEVWGFPTIAEYAVYGGGGYFMKLDVNMEVSANIFKELVDLNWLDEKTRAVILEFTIYNGNSNLYCYSKFVAEFPEVGGVVTYLDIQVFRLDSHYGPDGEFILFLEFIFLLCVLAATLKIFQELATDVRTFMKSVWNVLDLVALVASYVTIGCFIYKLTIAAHTSEIFREDKNAYVGFENIAFYDFVVNTAHSVLVFLLSMRVSRILGYSGKINEMAAVIAGAADDLLAFIVIFGITYFSYVAYGTLLFGKETAKYRDMFHTYGTLTEAVVGKNRLEYILNSKPGYAEFYYFTFVLFVLFTLVTMAAAILNFSISNVKEETGKMAPTNIVEVIIDRIKSLFRRVGGLSGNKGDKYKVTERRTSETELNDILSELRLFLRTINENGAIPADSKHGPAPPVNPKGFRSLK